MTLGCWTFREKEGISSGQPNGTNSVHRKKYNYEIYGDCVQILLLLEEKYMRASLGILIPVKE